MRILAVDDEAHALGSLEGALREVFPGANIFACLTAAKVEEFLEDAGTRSEGLDYVFLDVNIGPVSGMDLARHIREIIPKCRFIFCTAHKEYALEAFMIYATGYLIKPISADMIRNLLENLGLPRVPDKRVFIRTFGNFEMFTDKGPVQFHHSKAKELMAYLVDRRGSGVTSPEAYGVLWEDYEYGPYSKDKIQHVKKDLKDTLSCYGIGDIILSSWNWMALDAAKVDCDYYDYLKGKPEEANDYNGEYMSQYSWAEHTVASLDNRLRKLQF